MFKIPEGAIVTSFWNVERPETLNVSVSKCPVTSNPLVADDIDVMPIV